VSNPQKTIQWLNKIIYYFAFVMTLLVEQGDGQGSPKGRQESLDVTLTVYTLFAFAAVVGPKG